jgi:hypothetical protein
MRKTLVLILIVCGTLAAYCCAVALCLAQDKGKKAELVAVAVLKNGRQRIATIRVPAGYKEETRSYVEGVLTTLTYPDGSYIVLHIGGMMKLPLFSEPTHRVSEEQVMANRIVRSGTVQNTNLFWREENSQAVFPPINIGFTNVPKGRLKLFEKSLQTFERAK